MFNSILVIVLCSLAVFGWLQVAILSIGNRQYPIWYRSHLLVKRKGVFKLIYFRPKFFHRYALDEVIFFFTSFAIIILGGVFSILTATEVLPLNVGPLVFGALTIFSFLFEVCRIIILDVTNFSEERYFKRLIYKNFQEENAVEIVLSEALEKTYQMELSKIKESDTVAIEKLDDIYIEYFKNIKRLKLVKKYKNETIKVEIQ